jgi:aminoglycoside phosphotransferase (APT) family kinase protein
VFRIGDGLAIRLPRSDDYVADLVNEVRWLPRLGPNLPAAVPDIVAVGQPSETFPRPWAVVTWVPGELPLARDQSQQALLAVSLGDFLQYLHEVDTTGAPTGPEYWGYRCGEPVTDAIDRWAEHAAAELADVFDPTGVREAWRRLREVPAATQTPCWVHTDLSAENLLAHPDGRLAGVIDFGGIGIGDRWTCCTRGASSRPPPASCFGSRQAPMTTPGPEPARGPSSAPACSPLPTTDTPCPPVSTGSPRWSRPSQARWTFGFADERRPARR